MEKISIIEKVTKKACKKFIFDFEQCTMINIGAAANVPFHQKNREKRVSKHEKNLFWTRRRPFGISKQKNLVCGNRHNYSILETRV